MAPKVSSTLVGVSAQVHPTIQAQKCKELNDKWPIHYIYLVFLLSGVNEYVIFFWKSCKERMFFNLFPVYLKHTHLSILLYTVKVLLISTQRHAPRLQILVITPHYQAITIWTSTLLFGGPKWALINSF